MRAEDYLDGQAGDLEALAKKFLHDKCGFTADEVWLQTLPRMFGYAFNPVSFWLCRRAGALEAVLCEVRNTFGEKHFYWIHPEGGVAAAGWYGTNKMFHVSPFFPVEGSYKFRFQFSAEKFRVDIQYFGPDQVLRLATWIQGQLQPLAQQTLLAILFRYGWMTPVVSLRIHVQAFRLWLKKARFYHKPVPPAEELTR